MVLAFGVSARRFVGLAVLLFFAIPFGASLTGCKTVAAVDYCNAGDSGPTTGQVAQITLSASLATTGESLNYGQIGTSLSASATDCKGNAVSVRGFTYASTSSFSNNTTGTIFADINPSTGSVCGGTWNRNSGGGIPDYTTCTPPVNTSGQYLAYVTATAQGTTSNAIAVYVHPVVTGVVLGPATPAGSCPSTANPSGNDPGTDCFPVDTSGTTVVAPVYDGTGCLSQTAQGQFVARVYANGKVDAADNITGQVGKIRYSAQGATNVVTIDSNGVATANLPGAAVITATIANSSTGTQSGYFATCPPAAITLSVPGQPAGTSSVNVSLNTQQPLTAVVTDTNGNPITGLSLEFNSTTPQTIPGGSTITPVYPGTAVITAVCQPGTCNPSPFSQIGLFGNGKPVTSNGITINAIGSSGTVIYMGSTQSQYLLPADFTVTSQQSYIKLQYPPNSMVLSQDGTTIYLGSPQGLMTVTTASNTATAPNQGAPGLVLAVSPDGGTVVVTDPIRQTISLLTAGGGSLKTAYNGIGTHAAFSPDSQILYVTTEVLNGTTASAGPLLTYSTFTDWQIATPAPTEIYTDAVVTVPSIGAYFAGTSETDGRTYCSTSTVGATGNPPTVANAFAPVADTETFATDRLGATTDGAHILGATANGTPTFTDIALALPTASTGARVCSTATGPVTFNSTATTKPLTGILPAATGTPIQSTVGSAITGVIPSSNSALAFVTYNGTSGLLPVYVPSTGTLSFLTLGNGATAASAPVSGIFSTDNLNFYTGTSGDDQVHIFSISGTTATEKSVITPNLPDANGNPVLVNLLVQHPKKLTN